MHEECTNYTHWMVEQLVLANDNGKSREHLSLFNFPEPWELKEMHIRQVVWIEPPEDFKTETQWLMENPGKKLKEEDITEGPDGIRLVRVQIGLWRREFRSITQGVKERSKNRATDAIGQDFMDSQLKAMVDKRRGAPATSGQETETKHILETNTTTTYLPHTH